MMVAGTMGGHTERFIGLGTRVLFPRLPLMVILVLWCRPVSSFICFFPFVDAKFADLTLWMSLIGLYFWIVCWLLPELNLSLFLWVELSQWIKFRQSSPRWYLVIYFSFEQWLRCFANGNMTINIKNRGWTSAPLFVLDNDNTICPGLGIRILFLLFFEPSVLPIHRQRLV